MEDPMDAVRIWNRLLVRSKHRVDALQSVFNRNARYPFPPSIMKDLDRAMLSFEQGVRFLMKTTRSSGQREEDCLIECKVRYIVYTIRLREAEAAQAWYAWIGRMAMSYREDFVRGVNPRSDLAVEEGSIGFDETRDSYPMLVCSRHFAKVLAYGSTIPPNENLGLPRIGPGTVRQENRDRVYGMLKQLGGDPPDTDKTEGTPRTWKK